MKFRASLAIILIITACLTAFAQKPVTLEEIVARVNADVILKSELVEAEKQRRAELSQQLQGAQLEQVMAQVSKDILRDLIDASLLTQQAKEMGLNADLEVVKNMEKLRQENNIPTLEDLEKAIVEQGMTVEAFKDRIRREYMSSQVLQQMVYPKIVVTNEEVRNYYDTHKQEFEKPAGYQIREILISTEGKLPGEVSELKTKADDALAAIKRGDDFGEVAQKYSDAPTAQDGGDLGFFEKGQLRKDWEDALAKTEKGQVTEILNMPYGFVILKLEDKHEGGVLPYEIAQTEVQNVIWQERVRPRIREFLTKLREDGFVEVKEGYVDTGAPAAKVSVSNPKN
jgi:peptidyl-prolyl cis-trans isomerase SurA